MGDLLSVIFAPVSFALNAMLAHLAARVVGPPAGLSATAPRPRRGARHAPDDVGEESAGARRPNRNGRPDERAAAGWALYPKRPLEYGETVAESQEPASGSFGTTHAVVLDLDLQRAVLDAGSDCGMMRPCVL